MFTLKPVQQPLAIKYVKDQLAYQCGVPRVSNTLRVFTLGIRILAIDFMQGACFESTGYTKNGLGFRSNNHRSSHLEIYGIKTI